MSAAEQVVAQTAQVVLSEPGDHPPVVGGLDQDEPIRREYRPGTADLDALVEVLFELISRPPVLAQLPCNSGHVTESWV